MQQRFIPDTIDSNLIQLKQEYSADDARTVMNYRLHVLLRVLFGDQIVVPQGWALDSVAFIQVVSEIQRAIVELRNRSVLTEGLNNFSPFIMECHSGMGFHLDTLKWYLSRKDCYWSGLPVLRGNESARQTLLSKLRKSTSQDVDTGEIDNFVKYAGDIFENPTFAQWWGNSIDYFRTTPSKRHRIITMKDGLFIGNVQRALKYMSDIDRYSNVDSELIMQLSEFSTEILSIPEINNSYSDILSRAERNLDFDGFNFIKYVGSYAFIRSAAECTHAETSTPSIYNNNVEIAAIGEQVLNEIYHSDSYDNNIYFRLEADNDSQLVTELRYVDDWNRIWQSAITLSFDSRWISNAARLRSLGGVNISGTQRSERDKLIRVMESMIERACPNLVLYQTGAERIGIRYKRWTPIARAGIDLAQKGAASTIAGAALSFVAKLDLPIAIVYSGSAGWAVSKALEHFKGTDIASKASLITKYLNFNPFDKKSLLSSKTTLLKILK